MVTLSQAHHRPRRRRARLPDAPFRDAPGEVDPLRDPFFVRLGLPRQIHQHDVGVIAQSIEHDPRAVGEMSKF